jgi:acyl transferase domain-containing protein/acyl carrier protein
MTMSTDTRPRAIQPADAPDPPIAIVGVGALFPGSTTTQGFWGDIVAGRECVTEIPATHWRVEDYYDPDPSAPDKIYSRRGAFLTPIDFSPLHFGIPPATLPAIDSVQLLALEVAERVVTDMASRAFASVDRDRIGVILGVASTTEMVTEMAGRLQAPRWERELRAAGLAESDVQRVTGAAMDQYVPWQESTFPGLLGNVVAGRIANRFDLGGSNFVIDAACGSSLAALEVAVSELYLRRADLVISGGVDALGDVLMFKCFALIGALSRSGTCRPFADGADGTLIGEGLGLFALKRLADAERDGDHVYAVIRGIGSSSDRRALSVYAPRAEGQAKAVARAYARAGYGPEDVELVEAHGTGTRAGDLAEVQGLRQIFEGGRRPGTQWCALGSVKSQIGHTKAAAGAAGLFKVAMALHHRILPPTINVERPDPRLGLDESPFYLNTRARPWVKAPGVPRRASVSAFGFGGTNFHVTLEEYTGPAARAPRLRTMPSELLLVSAADRDGLAEACRACARRLAAPGATLDAIARDTHEAFSAHAAERVALVVGAAGEAALEFERLAAALLGAGAVDRPGVSYGQGEPAGKLAFLFPGQGSQYVGMGADLAMHFDVARQIWDEAAGFQSDLPGGFTRIVFPSPSFDAEGAEAQERALRATEYAQPAVATAGAAGTALLRQLGLTPAWVAGHSLGEITALAAAGAFDFDTLIATASERGRAMAAATSGKPGAMTAVLASRDRVEAILRAHGPGVVVANYNAPGQTVISGEPAVIERIEAALPAAGIEYRRLSVAGAFHSPLLGEAASALETFLGGRRLQSPTVPVYSHVTASPYASDVAALRAQVGRAIVSPVRFIEQIEALYRDGARVFVEPGPDNVLTRLVGDCLKDRRHVAVALDRRGVHGVTSLWRALGALAAAGVPFDLAPLWDGQVLSLRQGRPPDPTTVRICGANFGKRYPPPAEEGVTVPLSKPVLAAAPVPESKTPRASRASEPRETTPPREVRAAGAPRSGAYGVPASERVGGSVGAKPPGSNEPWLEAFSALQQQTAAAHADFQRLLAERHEAFLRASTEGLRQLAALAGAAPLDVEPFEVERPPDAATTLRRQPDDLPRAVSPTPPPIAPPLMSTPAASTVPAPAAPRQSRSDVLLDIVAEKTGYPREALDLTMDLESDLGIDSIKRIEILAAANRRLPDLPRLQVEKLSAMRTLEQISGYIERAAADSADAGAAAVAPAATPARSDARTPAPSPSKDEAPAVPSAPIERWVTTWDDVAAPGVAPIDLRDGEPLCVVGDHGGIGRALATHLSRKGIPAEVVEAPPTAARRIVLVASPGANSVESALAVNRTHLSFVASRARMWEEEGGLFLAIEHGDDADAKGPDAWLGGLAALCRTARIELPRLTARSIRLRGRFPDADGIAGAIADELMAGGTETEIHLSADGRRQRPRLETRPMIPGELPLKRGDVVVVSGGARGITAEAVIALAQQIELRLLLLGRTPVADEPEAFRGIADVADLSRLVLQHARAQGAAASPTDVRSTVANIVAAREVAEVIARLRKAGSDVRYAATDVADARAVGAAVEAARRAWGPIKGVIHGAGAVADAWLRDKTDAHAERVFAPKLLGLANLLAATAADPLRLICAFSSVVVHVGNAGQSDYAMANSIIERVAASEAARRGASCHVRALAWGPWDTGMVTPHLREKFARAGVQLIDTHAGSAAFVRALASRGDETTVILIPRPAEQQPEVRVTRERVGAALRFSPAVANDIEL